MQNVMFICLILYDFQDQGQGDTITSSGEYTAYYMYMNSNNFYQVIRMSGMSQYLRFLGFITSARN